MDAQVSFDPREDAYSKPLDQIDVSVPELYQQDIYQPYFERLRRDDPVHYCTDSHFGPYWSVTRYKDIMAVAVNNQVFSSRWDLGGVRLEDQVQGYERPSFIQMDEPDHGERRKAVSPVVAPANLERMEGLIGIFNGKHSAFSSSRFFIENGWHSCPPVIDVQRKAVRPTTNGRPSRNAWIKLEMPELCLGVPDRVFREDTNFNRLRSLNRSRLFAPARTK